MNKIIKDQISQLKTSATLAINEKSNQLQKSGKKMESGKKENRTRTYGFRWPEKEDSGRKLNHKGAMEEVEGRMEKKERKKKRRQDEAMKKKGGEKKDGRWWEEREQCPVRRGVRIRTKGMLQWACTKWKEEKKRRIKKVVMAMKKWKYLVAILRECDETQGRRWSNTEKGGTLGLLMVMVAIMGWRGDEVQTYWG